MKLTQESNSLKKFVVVTILLTVVVGLVQPVEAAPTVSRSTVTEAQMILSSHGYSIRVDGDYGPQTQRAVRHWQAANRLYVDGIPGPVTMQSLRDSITGPANATQVAKRLNPPHPVGLNGLEFAPEGLDQCAEMVFYMRQAGLPERFGDSGRHSNWVKSDGIGWRESKCQNTAVSGTGCCVGYWQNYISSHLSKASQYRDRIINECGVTGRDDILGDSPIQKQRQACVTKVVFDISGLRPWGGG
jgi:peptidoglycan hydrolase-like protein with peptidoglycan-binding domain